LPAVKRLRVQLFVYGSLKRGGLHHEELRGAPFLGEARTVPGFRLEPWGQYQALVPAPGTDSSVAGELFDIPSELLPELDEFEGDAYERKYVEIRLEPEIRPEPKAESERSERREAALAYFRKSG
jgi:gamma-glutamylcyclotransferase (GGCT)/AIG2-like uncharacterized protein YtfP